jgi:transposase
MAKPYSDDLRRKLLEAHQDGEGTLEELAEQFRVSGAWARKISACFHRTGKMERPEGKPRGRQSKVTVAVDEFVKATIAARPDVTLAELQLRLWQERKLEISIGWLWHTLERLGLRLKKNAAR